MWTRSGEVPSVAAPRQTELAGQERLWLVWGDSARPRRPHALRVAAAVPGRQPALPCARQAVGPGPIPLPPLTVRCMNGQREMPIA